MKAFKIRTHKQAYEALYYIVMVLK